MSYPPSFVMTTGDKDKGLLIFKESKVDTSRVYTPNIVILTSKIENFDFDKYLKQKELSIQKRVNIIERKRVKLKNRNYLKLVSEFTERNTNISSIQFMYAFEDVLHRLTFSCETKEFDKYYKEINESFLSFKMK